MFSVVTIVTIAPDLLCVTVDRVAPVVRNGWVVTVVRMSPVVSVVCPALSCDVGPSS